MFSTRIARIATSRTASSRYLLSLKEIEPRKCGEAACSVSLSSRIKNVMRRVCDLADHSADDTVELDVHVGDNASYNGLRIAHVASAVFTV